MPSQFLGSDPQPAFAPSDILSMAPYSVGPPIGHWGSAGPGFVHPHKVRWESEKALTELLLSLVYIKTPVCYQHYSDSTSLYQLLYQLLGRKSALSQVKPGQADAGCWHLQLYPGPNKMSVNLNKIYIWLCHIYWGRPGAKNESLEMCNGRTYPVELQFTHHKLLLFSEYSWVGIEQGNVCQHQICSEIFIPF